MPFSGERILPRLLQRGIEAALLCLFNDTGSEKIFMQRSIAQCTQSFLPDAVLLILCSTSTTRSAGSDYTGRPDMRRICAAVGDQGWQDEDAIR